MAPEHHDHLTRRQILAAGGAAGLALVLPACGDDDEAPTSSATTTTSTTTAEEGAASCVLTPEQTEGPYYLPDSLVRRDITEGRDGTSLELRLTVQDATRCDPIEGAIVELWHCDAGGTYSGVQDDTGTFLRGGQRTGADGTATFATIFPGWYQGRTTHIHVKVHAGGEEVHTGQLFFDEAVTRRVHGQGAYAAHGEADTTNSTDSIFQGGGAQSTVAVSRSGDGYTGRLTMGVRV